MKASTTESVVDGSLIGGLLALKAFFTALAVATACGVSLTSCAHDDDSDDGEPEMVMVDASGLWEGIWDEGAAGSAGARLELYETYRDENFVSYQGVQVQVVSPCLGANSEAGRLFVQVNVYSDRTVDGIIDVDDSNGLKYSTTLIRGTLSDHDTRLSGEYEVRISPCGPRRGAFDMRKL